MIKCTPNISVDSPNYFLDVPLIVYGFGMGLEFYLFWTVWIQYLLVIISPIIAALTK